MHYKGMLAHPAWWCAQTELRRGVWNHHEVLRWSGDLPTIANGLGLLLSQQWRRSTGRRTVSPTIQARWWALGHKYQEFSLWFKTWRGIMATLHVCCCTKATCSCMTWLETSQSGYPWGVYCLPSHQWSSVLQMTWTTYAPAPTLEVNPQEHSPLSLSAVGQPEVGLTLTVWKSPLDSEEWDKAQAWWLVMLPDPTCQGRGLNMGRDYKWASPEVHTHGVRWPRLGLECRQTHWCTGRGTLQGCKPTEFTQEGNTDRNTWQKHCVWLDIGGSSHRTGEPGHGTITHGGQWHRIGIYCPHVKLLLQEDRRLRRLRLKKIHVP